MLMNPEQQKEFEIISRPVMKFINDNCDPHAIVVIDGTNAQLTEGVCGYSTNDYLKD